jgi:hypothetical protein
VLVSWVVIARELADRYQQLEGTYCLHPQVDTSISEKHTVSISRRCVDLQADTRISEGDAVAQSV